jgi:hypothetical protein
MLVFNQKIQLLRGSKLKHIFIQITFHEEKHAANRQKRDFQQPTTSPAVAVFRRTQH